MILTISPPFLILSRSFLSLVNHRWNVREDYAVKDPVFCSCLQIMICCFLSIDAPLW
jgi:hypothetical protein